MKQESKQEEATQEQPEIASEETIEVTPKVTSTEEKATSERPRTEDEFRKIQSLKGKAESRATKAEAEATSVKTQLQELRDSVERQRLATRQKEIADAKDDPDALSVVQQKHILADQQEAMDRKWDKAMELAGRYEFVDISDILKADTPKEMELMAQLKAQSKVTEQEKEETNVSPETTSPTPDSNTSDAAPTDSKQLRDNFIKDPYKYGKAYLEALAKRGQ